MRLSVWVDIFGDDIVVTAMVGRLEHLTRTRARKCTVRVFPHAGHGLLDFPPTDPRAANACLLGGRAGPLAPGVSVPLALKTGGDGIARRDDTASSGSSSRAEGDAAVPEAARPDRRRASGEPGSTTGAPRGAAAAAPRARLVAVEGAARRTATSRGALESVACAAAAAVV
jgi:hypothetical protein